MKVVEKFVSINGEGVRAGELACFIRFQGCNLKCRYCDTMWANEQSCPYDDMTPQDIVDYIFSTGVKNVTLTGGEPLLQKDIKELIRLLLPTHRVEIETNGSVSLKDFIANKPVMTMDYKLAGSGYEHMMNLDNFQYLTKEDTVKFVVSSKEDVLRSFEIIDQYHLIETCHVYLSPVFGSIEPSEIVDMMIENKRNDIRLQIQIHKVIWDPEKRGV